MNGLNKLIRLALVALCFAAFAPVARAATPSWSLSNVQKEGVNVNGLMYFLVNENISRDSIAALAGKGTEAFNAALSKQSAHAFEWEVKDGSGSLKHKNPDQPSLSKLGMKEDATYNFYALVFDTETITDKSRFYLTALTPYKTGKRGANTSIYFGNQATASAAPGAWKGVTPLPIPAKYLDAEGNEQTTNAFVVTASDSRVTWKAGWYVVTNEVTVKGGADCSGEVNLILADTGALTISDVKSGAGIAVSDKKGESFAIYGQKDGTGVLNVTGSSGRAGISGSYSADGSYITINGGTVHATGGSKGAGIGGNESTAGANVTINGGTVYAMGGQYGAGIGGGDGSKGSYITVNGGTVYATGGESAAGIGGGSRNAGLYIRINGGAVTATGGENGEGIGSGYKGLSASNVYVAEDVVVKAGDAPDPTDEIKHTGDQDIANFLDDKRYVTTEAVDPARAPDYATDDGKDWLYNHAIKGKAYPGEAAESEVDLFYVYPTLGGGEKVVIDGFRGIDDKTMRSSELTLSTAAGAFDGTGRCFADLTHVYAPFYRQLTLGAAFDISTNAQGEVVSDANARYVKTISQGPSYADVTNALTTYFAKWNNGRRLVLAGHSQGSAHLRLLMRDYFTLPENQDKAKLVICSYQIGYGMSAAEMNDITEKTKTKGQGQGEGFGGITFATNATDVGVIVSYNTMGEDSSGSSTLLPPDTIAINPITWMRTTGLADKRLNLGALTNVLGKADVIVPHLYGAQVVDTGFNRGEVVVCKELNGEVLEPGIFGTGSLHTKDYGAYWEDLHKNCYDRITAATAKAPVVGKPMDYAEVKNWMRLGDKSRTKSTAKPFDILYLYPTSTGSSEYVAPVDQNMKDTALGNYRQAVEPLESYANVYAPYYRQISSTGIMADPTADALQQNIARHVGKTDVFAALDYYFTNVNAGVVRPFVLASHSQGSASFKNAFEQYFTGEKKEYLKKMVAAYTIGYTFSSDWCAKYGVTFATGAADTGVLMTWNAEGPDAPACSNMLTEDPNGQAINPLNWMRDETYAPVAENLGSFSTNGTRVAGAADAQLKAARPGALVVTNQTGYVYAPEVLFGAESYHFNDWGMFRENACANILDRGKDLTGYCKLCTTNFPAHLCVSNATVTLTGSSFDVDSVGGTVWIPTNGFYDASVTLVPEKGYRLMVGGKEQENIGLLIASLSLLDPNGEFLMPDGTFEGISLEYIQRDPDYADATGKDWLFNHDIEAKRYEGEPAQDPGVDLFYFYPTSVNVSDDHTAAGICDIDDEYLRSEKGALSAWNMTGKVFGDFTHVYAPYYRQTPVDVEMSFPKDGTGYDKITEHWYKHAPYADVTNALTHYFTKINKDGARPFVLAGHSHGAGMLVLAMEHFFAEHRSWLGKMVACYAIGMGVSDKWEKTVKQDPGVMIATNATDTGVYVFWNTEGPGTSEKMISGLWPTNHVAGVNPITWTREEGAYAPASLNLGGWTADDSGAVKPGLYDASNNVAHGTVVCSSPDLVKRYMDASWGFGEKSLHGWDYKLYWENLRANALQRIKTMNECWAVPEFQWIPLAGTAIDYADPYNWVTNTGTAKPVDVFYVYPTMMLEGDSTIVPVKDAMKAKAYTNAYLEAASAFADYANVVIPAYRQFHMGVCASAQELYTEPRDFIDFMKGQLPRTDLFAALDYYFTNLNVKAERPFILAGHSQGSCMLKVAFEDYFSSSGTRMNYLKKMVAAYPLGYSFAPDWFDRYYPDKEVSFATNATDKAALVSWNTEGPNATKRSFVIENGALAINPMTWTTTADEWSETVPDAMIQERTADDYAYAPLTYALVTTNVDASAYLPASMGMGDKSLHGKDWTLWRDQIKANGFLRYATYAGLTSVDKASVPVVADATWKVVFKAKGQGEGEAWSDALVSPADGTPYVAADAQAAQLVYTLNGEATSRRFINGETTTSFPLKKEGNVWVPAATEAEIKAATKSSDTPTVQLGVVAQRYPWNGTLEVGYRLQYAKTAEATLKVTVNGTEKTQGVTLANGANTLAFDAKQAFGEIKDKAVKVTLSLK